VTPPPQFGPGWTAPPPPAPPAGSRPIRAGRVWAGIGLAVLGHLAVVGCVIGGLVAAPTWDGWILAGAAAELALLVGTIVAAVLLLTRGDRGIGVGVIIGWAVGVILFPVVGLGICIYLYAQISSGT
jgi:hypothetical protein